MKNLPTISPEVVNTLDSARVLEFLGRSRNHTGRRSASFIWRTIRIKRSLISSKSHSAPFGPVFPAALRSSSDQSSWAWTRRRCGQCPTRKQPSPARERSWERSSARDILVRVADYFSASLF